jgi:YidC/Oxa1 family membrane protein insertase
MEKRAILFLVLSVIILLFYPYFLQLWLGEAPNGSEKAGGPEIQKEIEKSEEKIKEVEPLKTEELVDEMDVPAESEERYITVETELLKVVLSNRGGVIKKWELKKYKDHLGKNAENIELIQNKQEKSVYPLALSLGNDEPDEGFYTVEGGDLKVTGSREKGTLSFVREEGGGRIRKELTFFRDSYRVELRVSVPNGNGKPVVYLGENFGITNWGHQEFVGFVGPVSLVDGQVEKDKIDKMENRVQHFGKVRWAALQDKYFISALLTEEETETRTITKKLGEDRTTIGLELPERDYRISLYAGPKEYDRLKALNAFLEEAIDFGWFIYGSWSLVRLVAKPLFSILNFFHEMTHNYGISIILLTVLIKVLVIPLTHKSYKSMKGMQAIQPQMVALQKKYKNDREKLNREMLALYKTHKVNPLGGCLPVILQIPFFIALFNILYTTIELRQAPFILWINDLSDKDPFYVLPILMGGTMFLQQKIQPTPLDPRQAKIMMFLPLVFTILFLNFSSGLVLYWMTNNILTIAQQYVTMHYSKDKKIEKK